MLGFLGLYPWGRTRCYSGETGVSRRHINPLLFLVYRPSLTSSPAWRPTSIFALHFFPLLYFSHNNYLPRRTLCYPLACLDMIWAPSEYKIYIPGSLGWLTLFPSTGSVQPTAVSVLWMSDMIACHFLPPLWTMMGEPYPTTRPTPLLLPNLSRWHLPW